MHRPTRRTLLTVGALAPAIALGACSTGPTGSSSDPTNASSASGADADAFPVTITHAFGETTIEKPATKVVTVGWSDHDSVAALGVVPVAAPKVTWGGNKDASTDYFDAQIREIGGDPREITRYDDADGIPVDEIAAMEPDLILGVNSGMTQQDYDRLSKIAPTVGQPEGVGPWATPWEDQTTIIGEALGRKEQGEQLVADTDKAIDEALAKYPEIKGKTAAWLWFTPTGLSTVGVYTGDDLRPQLLRRFGMKDAPIVTELTDPEKGSYSATVSAEKSETVEADVVIFYVDEADQEQKIVGDDLLGQIPAIKSKHYVASLDKAAANPMSSPSPLAIPVALEEFLPKIASAAKGEPAR